MHYCCLVFTKEFPTDEVLHRVLAPYDENELDERSELPQPFSFDWFEVGGRYNGKLKLRVDESTWDKYRLIYFEREPRAGRLFRSSLLETMARFRRHDHILPREEDFFGSMGFRDDFLYVDGGPVNDMINLNDGGTDCFCFVDAMDEEQTTSAREMFVNYEWVKDEEFDDKVKEVTEKAKRDDCYICVVDLHD